MRLPEGVGCRLASALSPDEAKLADVSRLTQRAAIRIAAACKDRIGPNPAATIDSPALTIMRTHANGRKWPKSLPTLTAEQQRIGDDWMKYWHELLPRRYGIVDRFNHRYVVRNAPARFTRTLEIGAGLGEHLAYEVLTPDQQSNYYAVDLRENMAAEIRRRHPGVHTIVGDCQGRLDFEDGFFDRILAIHVLEHLPDLPAALREVHRLCSKPRGVVSVVIPCLGGLAYRLAQRITSARIFRQRYGQPYAWFIDREHINRPEEIIDELSVHFDIVHRGFFPLLLPAVFCNLCIGITLQPRKG